MEGDFNRPACKKIRLWKQISNTINKTASINSTATICDTKYRNLLATYRKNKEKQKSTGAGAVKWDYFDIMDNVLGGKASSCPPTEDICDSLETDLEAEAGTSGSCEVEEDAVTEKKNTKRKSGISFQSYLAEKMRREERLEKEKKEKEEEKQKREQEKWQEKKVLKEKEIDAILALANAIAGKKN